jgi:PBSX family phage terminase large subunit
MATTTDTRPGETMLYQPRGAAKALFPCRDMEVLIEGPAGTGKSRAVLEKLVRWLLKCPGSRALITRKTRASMTQSVLVTLEEKVIPDNSDLYPDLRAQQRKTRQSYVFPNGSELVVGGMDDPGRIMSTEYDMIAAFEATELTEGDWESLLSRLRNGVMPYHQAIADCNPSSPSHWLNQRAAKPYTVPEGLADYIPAARAGQTQMTRMLSRHEDNPRMYDLKAGRWTAQGAKYLGTLNGLTGARKLRLLSGIWAAQEGLVYEAFDAAVHVVDPFPVPPEWRRIRVIDFGYTNPFVCHWWAIDPDGRMYLYREIYRSGVLVEDHAKRIVELSAGENIEATIADHDAEDRATLSRHGIPTMPAFKAITVGIQAVAARLTKQVGGDGKERPRLFILRDALTDIDPALVAAKRPISTLQEFDGYAYPKGADGKPVKEEPLKVDDHGMDTTRYAVAYVDGISGGLPLDFARLTASVG